MARKVVNTGNAPTAVGPYSQAIVSGGFVFCSGQIAINPTTGEMEGTVKEQTQQCLKNLGAVLEAAGTSLAQAVKVTVFLKDMKRASEMNEAYAEFFSVAPPARACVEVSNLPKNALIEIDAVAAVPGA
jgi:2-iminobutanoate/2-iminopropanoate deaminase